MRWRCCCGRIVLTIAIYQFLSAMKIAVVASVVLAIVFAVINCVKQICRDEESVDAGFGICHRSIAKSATASRRQIKGELSMQAGKQTTDRGDLVNVLHEDGRRASVLLPKFDRASPLSRPAANLHASTEMFAGVVNNANDQFLPVARGRQLRSAAVNVLSKPFVALQSAGQEEKQAIDTATMRAMTVDPATPATAPIRARTLSRWDAADVSTKAAMLNHLPVEGLAALHESGALDDVPSDLRTIACDRYMVQRHIVKTRLQANFQKLPDVNNPLATGPDVEAAAAAAQKALDALKDRLDAVDRVADLLRNVVAVASIATDLPVDRAYSLLVDSNAAA